MEFSRESFIGNASDDASGAEREWLGVTGAMCCRLRVDYISLRSSTAQ